MWRYRITRLLSRKYPEQVIPDALAVEGSNRREWNRFLEIHYRHGWNVNESRVMNNAPHVAVYFGSYLKKPPVPMSRLEHYVGQDEIGLCYNSHRTKREEYRVMSGDEFIERFSWHVADKGFRMVRYYEFLSSVKRRLLEGVVYAITETMRKTARQITWRRMYQQLLKVDPLKCAQCGSQMRFTRLKRGYRLAELVMMHEPWPGCGGAAESRRGAVASILREMERKAAIDTIDQSIPSIKLVMLITRCSGGVE